MMFSVFLNNAFPVAAGMFHDISAEPIADVPSGFVMESAFSCIHGDGFLFSLL